MTIYAWEMPLMVMGVLIVGESIVAWILEKLSVPRLPRWILKACLSLLVVAVIGVFVIAILGASEADKVSSVLTGVAALLTYVAYHRNSASAPAKPTDPGGSDAVPPV